MQLISKLNTVFRFLLCVIDILRKYAWFIPLKDKNGITITNAFPKTLKESNRKTNKIGVDKGSEFYNRSMKSWLEKNGIDMYSTNNRVKSVIAERFIRALKNQIYKYMTSVSKNISINKINKYNNTHHSTIKMKPVDVKSNTFVDSSKEINKKDPKSKTGHFVRISKQKSIVAKFYTPSWSEEVFVIKKVKNTVLWTYVINDLNGEEIVETFYEKELQTQQIKKILELKK